MRGALVAVLLATLAGGVGWISIASGQSPSDPVRAIRASRVLPMGEDPIENGIVLVRGSRIEEVGHDIEIPPGAEVTDLGDATLIPGLVDARAVYGMTGGLNEEHSEVTPNVRAADSIDFHQPAFQRAIRAGVTAAYIAPGTRNVVSGRGAVVKTAGNNRWIEEAAAMQATLGRDPARGNRTPRSGRPRNFYYRRPTNRMGVTSVIRRALFEAQSGVPGSALTQTLQDGRPIRFTARHSSDVRSALKLSSDFTFPLIIDDAGESYVVADEIGEAGASVVLRVNADPHARGIAEGGDVALDAAARLHAAGVRLALATWADPGSAGPQDAAVIAHRFGLPREAALRGVTADAAAILGVADRIGSIAKGMDADLVAFDGDPLQPTSRVIFVMVDGRVEFRASDPGDAGEPVTEKSETKGEGPGSSMNER